MANLNKHLLINMEGDEEEDYDMDDSNGGDDLGVDDDSTEDEEE